MRRRWCSPAGIATASGSCLTMGYGGSLGALDARALTAGGASTSAGATGASPGDGAAEAVVMVALAQAAALERVVNATSTLAHQVDWLASGGGSGEEGFGLDGDWPLTHPLTAR